MTWIECKTRNVKGAYLYAPESETPLPLVVWLTGGNDGAQLPLRFSLGKLLDKGELKPDCAVLMPAASYGHNYTTMTVDELAELCFRAHHTVPDIDLERISLCGWSLGADAAAILSMEDPVFFDRICLLSNYPKAWKGTKPVRDYRILVGANEASSRRDWGTYPVERIPGYDHMIGDQIWLDGEHSPLGWLMGGGSNGP